MRVLLLGLLLLAGVWAQPIYSGTEPNHTTSDSVNFRLRLTQGFDVRAPKPVLMNSSGYKVKNGYKTYYLYVVKCTDIFVNDFKLDNKGMTTYLVVHSNMKRAGIMPDTLNSRALYLMGMIDTIGLSKMLAEQKEALRLAKEKEKLEEEKRRKALSDTTSQQTDEEGGKGKKKKKDKKAKGEGGKKKDKGSKEDKDGDKKKTDDKKTPADKPKGDDKKTTTQPPKKDEPKLTKEEKKKKKENEAASVAVYTDHEAEDRKKQEEAEKKKAEKEAAKKKKQLDKSTKREQKVLAKGRSQTQKDSLNKVLADSMARKKAYEDSLAAHPPPPPPPPTYEELQYAALMKTFRRYRGGSGMIQFFRTPFFTAKSLKYNLESCPYGVPYLDMVPRPKKEKKKKGPKKVSWDEKETKKKETNPYKSTGQNPRQDDNEERREDREDRREEKPKSKPRF